MTYSGWSTTGGHLWPHFVLSFQSFCTHHDGIFFNFWLSSTPGFLLGLSNSIEVSSGTPTPYDPIHILIFWYLSGNRKEQSKHLTSSTLGSPRSWTCSLMKRHSSPLPSGLSSLLLQWPLWHLDTSRSNPTIYRHEKSTLWSLFKHFVYNIEI